MKFNVAMDRITEYLHRIKLYMISSFTDMKSLWNTYIATSTDKISYFGECFKISVRFLIVFDSSINEQINQQVA